MTTVHPVALARLADPPLDPSADDARSALRRELEKPEYHDSNLVERILRWIDRVFDDTVGFAADVPGLQLFIAAVVVLALLLAISSLVTRARRTTRARAERGPALTDEVVTAAELRARADAALAEGRFDDAVVDGFRAVAVRQVERGRIEDLPQATAHELAAGLGTEFPAHRPHVDRAADVFDAVLYGDHPASREQALDVLALDDELAGRRERVR